MSSSVVRKFSPPGKPTWAGRTNQFGPVLPDGPTLALTKTHVALQEKTTELDFLRGTFSRAQSAWVQEKGEMENQIRDLRNAKSQLERDVRALKARADEQGQVQKLDSESWAAERRNTEAIHSQEVNQLKANIHALTAEVEVLEARNRQMRLDLQMRSRDVSKEQQEQTARIADARLRETETRAAVELQAIWQDRTNLLNQNADLQNKVRQLQAELEEERKIRAAHLSHSAVLAGDKARINDHLARSKVRTAGLEAALQQTLAANQKQQREESSSPGKSRPSSARKTRSSTGRSRSGSGRRK